jgi:hypothetical protein
MEKQLETAYQGAPACRAPGLWKGIATGLREIWDRIGLTFAISLTWTVMTAAALAALSRGLPHAWPSGIRGAVALLGCALVGAPGFAGACWVAHLSAEHEDVDYIAYWRGVRRLFVPAAALGSIHVGVLLLASLSLWFYAHLAPAVGVVCGLVCVYVLLVWAVMAPYEFPILAAQEAGLFDEEGRRARRGALAAIRRSFYLALGAPLYSLGLLLVCALLTAAFALLPMLSAGALAMVVTAPTRSLLVRFGVLPAPPAPIDRGFQL